MKTPDEIKRYILETVEKQLPQVTPAGVREWISARLIEPYVVKLAVDPDGKQIEDFWIVTDHKDGKHCRIAYSPDDNSFGIVNPLKSGVEWYMGDYGSFKEASEGI